MLIDLKHNNNEHNNLATNLNSTRANLTQIQSPHNDETIKQDNQTKKYETSEQNIELKKVNNRDSSSFHHHSHQHHHIHLDHCIHQTHASLSKSLSSQYISVKHLNNTNNDQNISGYLQPQHPQHQSHYLNSFLQTDYSNDNVLTRNNFASTTSITNDTSNPRLTRKYSQSYSHLSKLANNYSSNLSFDQKAGKTKLNSSSDRILENCHGNSLDHSLISGQIGNSIEPVNRFVNIYVLLD